MQPRKVQIAPSILSADFAAIGDSVALIADSGADLVHCDVMDGHFVPNLTFGPKMISDISQRTRLPLDVHLMVEAPDRSFRQYIDAGASLLTFHFEACVHAHRLASEIRASGCRAGISLVPSTPVSAIREMLHYIDLVLVMSVNPGFGGQVMIPRSLDRIRELVAFREENGLDFQISVDGGVHQGTASSLREAGADILVAGNAFFTAEDHAAMVRILRGTD